MVASLTTGTAAVLLMIIATPLQTQSHAIFEY